MHRLTIFLLFLAAVSTVHAHAQATPNPDFYNGAVIGAFQERDPTMVHFSLLYRGEASDELDVILVRGGSATNGWRPRSKMEYVIAGDLLGLFLIDRSDPAIAYELAVESDINEGYEAMVTVERAVPGELTVLLLSNYGMPTARRKYSYSASNKQLVSKIDFWPRGLSNLAVRNDRTIIWGRFPHPTASSSTQTSVAVVPAGAGFLQIESPFGPSIYRPAETELLTFGVNSTCTLVESREDAIVRSLLCIRADGTSLRFEAPLTDFARFSAARPAKVRNGWTPEHAIFNETIGPYQPEDNKLWFGLMLSDGEGRTGVGGFGFFDAMTQQFEMHYPAEMAQWAASAILVEQDTVWFGLESRGEVGRSSGGLLSWDRVTREIRRWPDAPRITGITRQGDRLYMATSEGAAIFENGQFVRHVLDVNRDGEYGLARRELR